MNLEKIEFNMIYIMTAFIKQYELFTQIWDSAVRYASSVSKNSIFCGPCKDEQKMLKLCFQEFGREFQKNLKKVESELFFDTSTVSTNFFIFLYKKKLSIVVIIEQNVLNTNVGKQLS
jgi:hypothetical protein